MRSWSCQVGYRMRNTGFSLQGFSFCIHRLGSIILIHTVRYELVEIAEMICEREQAAVTAVRS